MRSQKNTKLMTRTLLIALVCMLAVSCNKSADCYSCDADMGAFVKQNEIELRDMAVTELAAYSPEVQRAAFRMYDARKRQKVWEEKYGYILENNPNGYSEEELVAVRELADYVAEKGIDKTENAFINQWIVRTREDFLWSEDRHRFLVMSLDVDEEHYRKNYGIVAPTLVKCQCNSNTDGILIGDCPSSGECSTRLSCEERSWGCGPVWKSSCDGDCQPEGGYPFK